ncbi:unnamed protein product [Nezara viridula]|uniref:Uncharacterized protein n=1 Tax=Nezara viridula TaxID=85310 RepID=A0A9P0HCF0_NEZVI|nr:unnamed protein product [Nezara viridula]
MIPRESRAIFSANLATSLMSTPSASRKLLVLFGIVSRDPNQMPLTVNSLSLRRSHGISLLGKGYIYQGGPGLTRYATNKSDTPLPTDTSGTWPMPL